MTYSKEQILDYLKQQPNLKSAINNLDNIDSDKKRVVSTIDNKTLFYIEDHIKTRGQLKKRIIEYMGQEGWELRGDEEYLKLQELLDGCEMKIV